MRYPKSCIPLGLLLALLDSCAMQDQGEPATEARDAHALFEQIHVGASRAEVEAIIGEPLLPAISGVSVLWYLPPPVLEEMSSPWGPGSIVIRYKDGVVVQKTLNPQVQRPRPASR